MTTKEQERAALAKIEKILAGLDSDSWVNTAFAGAVEDARYNIENDFANSWQERAQHEARKNEKLEAENKDLKEAYTAARQNAERTAEKQIDKSDLRIMYSCLILQIDNEREKIDKYAAEIVKNADNPGSDEFIQAVIQHRKAEANEKQLYEASIRIVEKLNKM